MKTIEFTKEELQILLQVMNAVSFTGAEGMRKALGLIKKIEEMIGAK
jgi:hypothetical protein